MDMNETAPPALPHQLKDQILAQDPGNVPTAIKLLSITGGIKLISQIKSSSLVGIVSETFAVEIDANSMSDPNIPLNLQKHLKKPSEVR